MEDAGIWYSDADSLEVSPCVSMQLMSSSTRQYQLAEAHLLALTSLCIFDDGEESPQALDTSSSSLAVPEAGPEGRTAAQRESLAGAWLESVAGARRESVAASEVSSSPRPRPSLLRLRSFSCDNLTSPFAGPRTLEDQGEQEACLQQAGPGAAVDDEPCPPFFLPASSILTSSSTPPTPLLAPRCVVAGPSYMALNRNWHGQAECPPTPHSGSHNQTRSLVVTQEEVRRERDNYTAYLRSLCY